MNNETRTALRGISPSAQIKLVENEIDRLANIALGTGAIAETIEEIITARSDAGTEHIELVNRDGLIAGLALASRMLSEQQVDLLSDVSAQLGVLAESARGAQK